MRKIRIARKVLFLVLAAAGLFWVGFTLSGEALGLPLPKLAGGSSSPGENGPIGLVFSQGMQTDTVERRFKIDPDVKGRFEWGGTTTLWFFPEVAMAPGRAYQISLAAGSLGLDGQEVRQDESWQLNVRAPEIIYMSPTGDTSDLWLRSLSLNQPVQLTVGESTYDYGISYDGNQIAYSAGNDQKGYDLWAVDRDGKNGRKILDCGVGRCVNPAWSADGENIAYSRYDAVESVWATPTPNAYSQGNQGGLPIQLGASRIWTVNIITGRTVPLSNDLRITGTDPTWSSDGHWLAFIDTGMGGIRVVNLDTQADQLFPANTPVLGSWSQDGSRLFFADLDVNELPSFGAAFQIAVPSLKETGLFERGPDESDYGLPVMSPDGTWVAVGIRFVQGSSSRQLWLLSPDGSKQKVISGDQVITHGAYSWSPDGASLVFQQLELDSSTAKPDVMIWDASSGAMTQIAKDATHPHWLP